MSIISEQFSTVRQITVGRFFLYCELEAPVFLQTLTQACLLNEDLQRYLLELGQSKMQHSSFDVIIFYWITSINTIYCLILLQLVHMNNPSTLLPLKFGSAFSLRPLSWADFAGQIDQNMPWSAHIYWNIEYRILDSSKGRLSVNLIISKRSWVREQKKCAHLLQHEQGHYLIGGLCALEFLRRVDSKKKNSLEKFEDMVLQTFNRTMAQFLEMERQYDNETEHRLNFKMQQKWENLIYEKLKYYSKIFDKKKNMFVKLSESPSK